MAVVDVIEEARGRKGNILSLGGGDLERSFIVKTDNPATTQYDIYASGQIPYQGTSHPQNFMATLRQIEFDPIEKYLWRVSCRYSTRPEGQAEQQRRLDATIPPWFLPAIITGSYQSATRDSRGTDLNDKPFVTSGGTPYTPSPTFPATAITYTVRKKFPAMPAFFEFFAGKFNSTDMVLVGPLGPVATMSAGLFMYQPVSFSESHFAGPGGSLSFIELTYQFHFQPGVSQFLRLVDRGPHFKDANGQSQPFNEGGEFNLDGFGNKLADGAQPVTNLFRVGTEVQMAGIIPTS